MRTMTSRSDVRARPRPRLAVGMYSSAREFLEAVRAASIDAERIRHTLERMGVREQVRAQSYESRGRGGGTTDAMRATDERMDYESRARDRQHEDYALIDLCCDVIYGSGQNGSGGVCALLGSAYADCLWWRFCAAATWPEVADGCGMSERWCRDAVRVACDTIDAYGMSRIVDGLGLADADG